MKHTKLQPIPFCAIIDTREQTPLPFPDGFPTRRGTLYPGDYSADGLTLRVAFERKSVSDLIGTLFGKSTNADGSTTPRLQKFVEELTAMQTIPFRAVVIDQPLRMILEHLYQSMVPPSNVIRLIADIECHTGVPFKFFDSPKQAAMFVAAELLQAYEIEHGLSSIKYTVRKLRPERLKVRIPDAPKREK